MDGQPQPREPFVHRLELALVLALALLPERPGCRVPRIREQAISHRLLVGVERLEVSHGEEHLTTHLDKLRMSRPGKRGRDTGHVPDVLGHVLSDASVAPRGSRHEPPALVAQRQGETVDLELTQVTN